MKPSLRGRLVAELDEFLQVGLDRCADALARFPDLLPQRRVGGLLEDVADLAVGHLLAVDLGAEDVERLLDGVGLGGDLLQQLGRDLLFEVLQVEHVDLAGDERVVDLAASPAALMRLELGERLRVRRAPRRSCSGPLPSS